MARKIGDLGRVGDSKFDNGALMPNTCLGENQETNINIYISTTGVPDADGKKAAFVPRRKIRLQISCFRCCKREEINSPVYDKSAAVAYDLAT